MSLSSSFWPPCAPLPLPETVTVNRCREHTTWRRPGWDVGPRGVWALQTRMQVAAQAWVWAGCVIHLRIREAVVGAPWIARATRSWPSSFQESQRQDPWCCRALVYTVCCYGGHRDRGDRGGAWPVWVLSHRPWSCLSMPQWPHLAPCLVSAEVLDRCCPPPGLHPGRVYPMQVAAITPTFPSADRLCVLLTSPLLSLPPRDQAARATPNLPELPTFGFSSGDRGSSGGC